jgi:pyrroloquinoline quinone (PQQ) biosynthesis protein C
MIPSDAEEPWLVAHALFARLRDGDSIAWSAFAEAFAPLIYSVPAFLGVTLAQADAAAYSHLREVWHSELGDDGGTAHPTLFERVHRAAVSAGSRHPQLRLAGVRAGAAMVATCSAGPWPIGMAAMLAHEGEFPAAYGSILIVADRRLGAAAEFFHVHAAADIEHAALARRMIGEAIAAGVASAAAVVNAHNRGRAILAELADRALEVI